MKFIRILLAVSGLMFLALPASADNDPGGSLCFSLVPKKNVDQQLVELDPMLRLIAQGLGRPVNVIRPQSYNAVIEGVLSNTIDLAILGPAAYAKARARDSQVEAFAAFARKKGFVTPGGSYYYSVLFALESSGFNTLADLKGKKIALTDPDSTSGSVIPSMEFPETAGSPLASFFGTQIYTGSHDRSIRSVLQGHADAAFVSSARIDEAVFEQVVTPEQVAILWRSRPIYHDPLVFSGGLDAGVRQAIREILLPSPPELSDMFEQMGLTGIVGVSDRDYHAIHEIVGRQARQ